MMKLYIDTNFKYCIIGNVVGHCICYVDFNKTSEI